MEAVLAVSVQTEGVQYVVCGAAQLKQHAAIADAPKICDPEYVPVSVQSYFGLRSSTVGAICLSAKIVEYRFLRVRPVGDNLEQCALLCSAAALRGPI
jgi:hypothetical protein